MAHKLSKKIFTSSNFQLLLQLVLLALLIVLVIKHEDGFAATTPAQQKTRTATRTTQHAGY